MRRRDRQSHTNLLWRDIEHHQVLRQRKRAIIVLADFAFDFRTGVEVIEEMIDGGKTRLGEGKHLPRLLGCSVEHGCDLSCALLIIARAFHQLRRGIEAFVNYEISALSILNKELARRG